MNMKFGSSSSATVYVLLNFSVNFTNNKLRNIDQYAKIHLHID